MPPLSTVGSPVHTHQPYAGLVELPRRETDAPSTSGQGFDTGGPAPTGADRLGIPNDQLIFNPTTDTLAAFEADSTRFALLAANFKKHTDALSAFAHELGCARASTFQDDLNLLHLRVFYPDICNPKDKLENKVREQFFWMGMTDLEKICGFLRNEDIPLNQRREIINNLTDRMSLCGPGIGSYLSDAAENLYLASLGVPGKVKSQQTLLFTNLISQFAQQFHEGRQPTGEYADWEAHYANAYRNILGPLYDIPEKIDTFANYLLENRFVSDTHLEVCQRLLHRNMTPLAVAETLAEQCIAQAEQTLQGASVTTAKINHVVKMLQTEYGNFDQHALLSAEPGKPTEVRSNTTPLCLEMLKIVDSQNIFSRSTIRQNENVFILADDQISPGIHAPAVLSWKLFDQAHTIYRLENKVWLKIADERNLLTIDDLPRFSENEHFLSQCPIADRVPVFLELIRNSSAENIQAFLKHELPAGLWALKDSLCRPECDPKLAQADAEALLITLAENLGERAQHSSLIQPLNLFVEGLGNKGYDLHAVFQSALLKGKTAAVDLIVGYMARHKLLSLQNASGKTLLHIAAELGSTKTVDALLSQDRSLLEMPDHEGNTALHWACRSTADSNADDKLKTLRSLLDQGASLKARRSKDGQTVMHVAASSGNTRAINLLATLPEAKKLLFKGDEKGRYPLHAAAEHCQREDTISALINAGANPNKGDAFSWDALHYAMQHKNLPALRALLESGARLDKKSAAGMNIMHYAAEQGFSECLAVLAEYWHRQYPGADWPRDESGATPLHVALRHGHVNSAKALLNALSDIDARKHLLSQTTSIGNTVMHVAIGHPPLQRMSQHLMNFLDSLRQEGLLDPDLIHRPNRLGDTPLHQWAKLSHEAPDEPQLLQTLVANWRINLEVRNQQGRTPLLIAARANLPTRAGLLCLEGADPAASREARFKPSRDALHTAIKHGFTNVVRLLLSHSRSATFIDTYKDGLTPLMRAVKQGQTEMVRLLLDQGADPTLRDDLPYSKRTVLQRAKGYLRGAPTEIVHLIEASIASKQSMSASMRE